MVVWRLQGMAHPLINSEGAKLTGGRWNQPGTSVIYASENIVLAAMEVIVHHGGIPDGWPDLVPEIVTARQGANWVTASRQAILLVPSATTSLAGYNYILNPAHRDFKRIAFSFEPGRFHARLHSSPD